MNDAERQLIHAPESPPPTPTAPAAAARPAPVPWATLLTSGRLGLICAQQFFRAAAYIFYATQFPAFLQQTRHVSESESGFLSAFALFGVVVGSLAGGMVMDALLRRTGSRWASRKGVAVTGTVGGGVFLLLAFAAGDLFTMVALIAVSTGFAGLAGPAGYTITIDQGGQHVGTVFSIMNTAGNIGATLLPIVLGAFVRAAGWDDALLFIAVLYFASAVCWMMLPVEGEIFSKQQDGK